MLYQVSNFIEVLFTKYTAKLRSTGGVSQPKLLNFNQNFSTTSAYSFFSGMIKKLMDELTGNDSDDDSSETEGTT